MSDGAASAAAAPAPRPDKLDMARRLIAETKEGGRREAMVTVPHGGSVRSGVPQDPAAMAVSGVRLLRSKRRLELPDSDGRGIALRTLSRASRDRRDRPAGVFLARLQAPD